ncbi:MAG: BMP family ABC transporter substrate-binding protein [Candidatus Bathyarchaeia archaeon]
MKQKGSVSTSLITIAVIALLIGAAVGYFIAPKGVSKADYTTLQQQVVDLQAQVTTLTSPKKIGLILATGGLGDKSFNDISHAGVQRAKDELGIEFDKVEPTAISEYEGYQRDFASSGEYELIICVGFDQADALTIIAEEYPNQKFAIVDMVVDKPNVASLLFKANEGSFLVGVIAAAVTSQGGTVGFVGGMDNPMIRDFFEGYEAGVLWVSDNLDLNITIQNPVFVGGWGDPSTGKEMALSLVELGAEVIFVAAGGSGLGALEACNETGIWGIGVDASQGYLYPEIIASMTKRVDVAVYTTIVDALLGTFDGGFITGGLAEKWVGCDRLPDEESFWETLYNFDYDPDRTLTSGTIELIEFARFGIVSGTIVVPTGYD